MKQILFAAALTLLFACRPADPQADADAAVAAALRTDAEWLCERLPAEGRALRLRFDWSDRSEAGYASRIAAWEAAAAWAGARDTLAQPARLHGAAIRTFARQEAARLKLERAAFALHPVWGIQAVGPQFLVESHVLDEREDCNAFLLRLRKLPDAVADAHTRARAQVAAGTRPHPRVLAQSRDQMRAFAALDPLENPVYQSLALRLSRMDPVQVNEYQAVDYLTQTSAYLEESVYPAYRRAAAWLDSLLAGPAADLPATDYATDYAMHLAYACDGDAPDAAMLHDLARRQADSLLALMVPLLDEVVPDSRALPIAQRLRLWLAGRDSLDRQTALRFCRQHAAQMQRYAEGLLGRPVAEPWAIQARYPLPGQTWEAARYLPPTADGSHPGRLLIDLEQDPRDLPLLVEAYAIPGLDTWYQWTAPDSQPGLALRLRRFVGWEAAWRTYAVQTTAEDLGLHGGPVRLTYLHRQLQQWVRLLVDTGLHTQGWTLEEGERAFGDRCGLAPEAAAQAVDRCLALPGSAASEPWGAYRLWQLRQLVSSMPGQVFYLQEFHTKILDLGPVPLQLLDATMWHKP
ncbi:MAG: DUF885 family protein [Bacteroidia bacterium]